MKGEQKFEQFKSYWGTWRGRERGGHHVSKFSDKVRTCTTPCKISQGSCDPAALRLRIPLGYRPSASRSGTLNKKAEKAFNEKKSRNETTHIYECLGERLLEGVRDRDLILDEVISTFQSTRATAVSVNGKAVQRQGTCLPENTLGGTLWERRGSLRCGSGSVG